MTSCFHSSWERSAPIGSAVSVESLIERSMQRMEKERDVARKVARQLMSKDALGAHARDELGLSEITSARPVQAALTSAASFSIGAAAPLALVLLSPSNLLIPIVSAGSLVFLALLGLLGARTGEAAIFKPIIRVTFWGALAMAVTAGIGALVGTVV
jgi:VIT1/CCC1 family predicted Fe2+/Mn2+ transporter